ncbi:Oidioi.mRNA.OKI2018_I69.PAR.g12334.t1.cds [Oikopleura dioica]|uniref:Oidioi.mRNA.OKI2018_I69.PAR.g12334.t1.cds n=1 Tax=Oikopleura dioica TaxID=34765 RepID=A0ABN7S6E4_OIKDI|nr:Oidioi.mRNA.OKI2018_I69.PAR.g12334.t1.cds [Oikopleura dioica]
MAYMYPCAANMQTGQFCNTVEPSYMAELFNQTQSMIHYGHGNMVMPNMPPNENVKPDFPVMKMEPVSPTSSKPASPISSQPASPQKPTKQQKRPGPAPAIPDDRISSIELMKRNQRRERNRSAAARCRQKRAVRIEQLETEVIRLNQEKQRCFDENQALLAQIAYLKEQLNNVSGSPTFPDNHFPTTPTSVSNPSTAPSSTENFFNNFDFPLYQNQTNRQFRSYSS